MTDTKKYRADVLINGGGIAGLTLAALLGDQHVNVHVVESYPPEAFTNTQTSSRTVALMQSSLNILKATGLSDFCDQYGTKMEIMRIIDDSLQTQEPYESEFDSFDIGQDYFSMNIPNSLLRARLFEDVSAMNYVTIHAEHSLSDYMIEQNRVVARLHDGTVIETPLIVGADGKNSIVREIAGIKTRKTEYGQSAITCIINHSRSHNNTSTEFHREGGPFALVPLPGNQSSVVWVEKTEKADQLIKLSKDDFVNSLQAATNDILGGVTLETNPQSWPICAIKAKALIAERCALVAEAAHVMSPITAQGLNLSLRDVASLAEVVIDALRVGADHGSQSVLRAYQHRRNFDIETRTAGIHGMNKLVSNEHTPVKDLRRSGLKILDRIPPLKKFAMKHALAPPFDEGRLIKGKEL